MNHSQSLEMSGKTVEDAVSLALQELDADIDDVEVEVLEEGSKGIFGLGSKQAKVLVTVKETRVSYAKWFVEEILAGMNVDADIDVYEDEEFIRVDISGEDSGIIIGRRGETLDAIQYLASLAVNKNQGEYKRVIVDIENYRQKREETLVRLANRLADKVVRTKKSVALEPMNPFERRIIHSTLQGDHMVETYSVGDEPNRRVVITLKKK